MGCGGNKGSREQGIEGPKTKGGERLHCRRTDRRCARRLGSGDRLEFLDADDPDGPEPFRWRQSFARVGLCYERRVGGVDVAVAPWLGIDDTSILAGEQFVTRRQYPLGARADAFASFEWGFVAGGLDTQGGRVVYDLLTDPPPMPGAGDPDAPVRGEGGSWYALPASTQPASTPSPANAAGPLIDAAFPDAPGLDAMPDPVTVRCFCTNAGETPDYCARDCQTFCAETCAAAGRDYPVTCGGGC